ncbi:MAG: hypothetical protein ABIH69_05755 [bacterium]
MEIGGISRRNRQLLGILNRAAKGPFDFNFVANTLNIPIEKAKKIVNYWVKRGWLTSVKRGLYSTVSLSAARPESQKEDPWLVASTVFNPCYIGGWSAGEYFELTEQIFSDVVVFSSRRFNRREKEIQGTGYIIRTISKERFYGLKPVWRGQVKVFVSDLERTIVDLLDNPALGGGIRHTFQMINEYFSRKDKNTSNLIKYIKKYGNRVIYKRLGYLLEVLEIDAPDIAAQCSQNKSAGYSKLDPTLSAKGKHLRRWNLIINADLKGAV